MNDWSWLLPGYSYRSIYFEHTNIRKKIQNIGQISEVRKRKRIDSFQTEIAYNLLASNKVWMEIFVLFWLAHTFGSWTKRRKMNIACEDSDVRTLSSEQHILRLIFMRVLLIIRMVYLFWRMFLYFQFFWTESDILWIHSAPSSVNLYILIIWLHLFIFIAMFENKRSHQLFGKSTWMRTQLAIRNLFLGFFFSNNQYSWEELCFTFRWHTWIFGNLLIERSNAVCIVN